MNITNYLRPLVYQEKTYAGTVDICVNPEQSVEYQKLIVVKLDGETPLRALCENSVNEIQPYLKTMAKSRLSNYLIHSALWKKTAKDTEAVTTANILFSLPARLPLTTYTIEAKFVGYVHKDVAKVMAIALPALVAIAATAIYLA